MKASYESGQLSFHRGAKLRAGTLSVYLKQPPEPS